MDYRGYMVAKYRENAERHRARARAWTMLGRPEYALGSIRKAQKWDAKADAYLAAEAERIRNTPPFLTAILDILCEGAAADLEDMILNGPGHLEGASPFDGLLQPGAKSR